MDKEHPIPELSNKQRIAENVLRDAEELYHAIFEQAADSIVLIDPDSGELVEFNQRAHLNLGYTREEFKNLKIPDFEAVESAKEVSRHINKIAEQGSDIFETKHRTKRGDIRDILVNSKSIYIGNKRFIQSIWRDITQEKKALQDLKESEELYKTLVLTTPEAVTATDLAGKIVYISPYGLELYGAADVDELLGKNAFELIDPKDHERAKQNMKKTLSDGFVRDLEYVFLRKNGSKYAGEMSAALIRDAFGNPKGFISTVRDITERKKIEEQKLMHAEELQKMNKFLIGRELRMAELKCEINALLKELGREERYGEKELRGEN